MNFADFATETDKNIEQILIDALKVKYPTHGYKMFLIELVPLLWPYLLT